MTAFYLEKPKLPSLTIYKVITNVNLVRIMSTTKNNTN